MDDSTTLDQVDREIALREEATGQTRKAFLRKAGLGGAAVLGGGVLLGPGAGIGRAGHTDAVPDVDVLNFALSLEYLEATFYTQALGGPGVPGLVPESPGVFGRGDITGSREFAGFGGRLRSDAYGLLTDIRDHEVTHVEFLVGALGAAAVPPCTYTFGDAFGSVGSFLSTARLLENTGVMAYDGAIRYVEAGDFLQAGAQIATVEARHAAYLNLITGQSPFPSPFDTGLRPQQIIAAAGSFFGSCPASVLALFRRLP